MLCNIRLRRALYSEWGLSFTKQDQPKFLFKTKSPGAIEMGHLLNQFQQAEIQNRRIQKKIVLRHISFSSSFDSIECLNIVAVWKLN